MHACAFSQGIHKGFCTYICIFLSEFIRFFVHVCEFSSGIHKGLDTCVCIVRVCVHACAFAPRIHSIFVHACSFSQQIHSVSLHAWKFYLGIHKGLCTLACIFLRNASGSLFMNVNSPCEFIVFFLHAHAFSQGIHKGLFCVCISPTNW